MSVSYSAHPLQLLQSHSDHCEDNILLYIVQRFCNEKVAWLQVSPTTSAETTSQGAHQANWEAPTALVLLAY